MKSDPRDDAKRIFERWLEGIDSGHDVAFDEVVARHPDRSAELKELHAGWNRLRSIEALVFDGERDSAASYRGPGSLGGAGSELSAGTRLGPYQLDREIGRGGMGVVWRARNLVLGDDVALKFLPFLLAKDRLAMMRLRREARVLLALTHVNIVRLQTIEARRGLTFLVEEVLDGRNLEEIVDARADLGDAGRPALSPEEVLWILDEVAPALDYAHEEGVTHRDIKPSNLLLTREPESELGDGPERVKIADFGLAFIAGSALSKISSYRPSGTLPYMAPEVLMGEKPTPAADIYSLGATIYHLIRGEPPFARGDIATQVLHKAAPPARSGDAGLDRAVAAALSKDPGDRPATADELLEIAWGERQAPRRARIPWRAVGRIALAAGAVALIAGLATVLPGIASKVRGASESVVDPATAQLRLAPPFDDATGDVVFVPDATPDLRGTLEGFGSHQLAVYYDSLRIPVELDDDGAFLLMRPISTRRRTAIRFELGDAVLRAFAIEVANEALEASEPATESADDSRARFAEDETPPPLLPLAEPDGGEALDVLPVEAAGPEFEEQAWRPIRTELTFPAGPSTPLRSRAVADGLFAPRAEERSRAMGDAEVVGAVNAGLDWLQRHQGPRGGWDADGFASFCAVDDGERCDGDGHPLADVGVTSLALLAFLGDGHAPGAGPYGETVWRGLVRLLGEQDPNTGRIGKPRREEPAQLAGNADERDIDGDGPARALDQTCPTCKGAGTVAGPGVFCVQCDGTGRISSRFPPGPPRPPMLKPSASETTGDPRLHGHALATQALCEAYAVTRSPRLLRAARAAVAYLERSRNPYSGWRYESPPIGDNDTAVTCAALVALAVAREAGIEVDPGAFEGGVSWINEVSDPATGRVGYTTFGSMSSRTPANAHHPTERGEALTAAGLLCRSLVGQAPADHPILEKHADLLLRALPYWDPSGFSCDMYAWYYGTQALHQMGGKRWAKWSVAMEKAALESQRQDGDRKGSWDPAGPWGGVGGRVYATAMMTLCLEGERRYARVSDAR